MIVAEGRLLEQARDPATAPAQLGALAMRSLELGKAVAGNPAATPRILRCIAMRWKEAWGEVARHPALERALACRLAATHTEELIEALLANPALPPRIAGRRSLPRRVLGKLVAHEAAPRWLLPALVAHPHAKVREVAAGAEGTGAAALAALSRDADAGVRAAAAARRALPEVELLRLARDVDVRVRVAVAGRGKLRASVEGVLVDDAAPEVRARLAEYGRADWVLARLAKDAEVMVLCGLAANPQVEEERLVMLAGHEDAEVRAAVTQNPAASGKAIGRLITEPNAHVWFPRQRIYQSIQAAALEHPAMPEWAFWSAAMAERWEDRLGAARSPKMLPHLLKVMAARDGDERVRAAAIANPGWDPDADTDPVGKKVRSEVRADGSLAVRHQLAKRTRDAWVLAGYASSGEHLLRHLAASSVHTPAEALEKLARDESELVQEQVAGNPAAPARALRPLLQARRRETRVAAAGNPAAPLVMLLDEAASWPREELLLEALLQRLRRLPPGDAGLAQAAARRVLLVDLALAGCDELPAAVSRQLARSPHPEVRVALARGAADPERLAELGRDGAAAVRAAVAERAADEGVLVQLAGDGERQVMLAALRNPALPLRLLFAACRRGGEEAAAARAALRRLGHPRGG